MTTATKLRTTKIWADTVQQDVCRRCGRTVYRAQNVRTGNVRAFDRRPVPLAEQPELETRRVELLVDLAQMSEHDATCVGAKYFRRPR